MIYGTKCSVMVTISVVIMIVVIPIAFGVPAAPVFVPPAVVDAPAVLAGFAEFMTGVFGLPALPAMAGNGLVEVVIGARHAALAIVVVGAQHGRSSKHQKRCQRRGCQRLGSKW
jgi:hypothetical protein